MLLPFGIGDVGGLVWRAMAHGRDLLDDDEVVLDHGDQKAPERGLEFRGERGQRSGQIGDGADLALVVDMIWGTMWYRILSRHAPVDEALADELTEAVLRLLGPGTEGSSENHFAA